MTIRRLGCALLTAACLLLSTRGLEAAPAGMKDGASGQVYVWYAGTC